MPGIAVVVEGLGSKRLIGRVMRSTLEGRHHSHGIAYGLVDASMTYSALGERFPSPLTFIDHDVNKL